jgi:putative endonuclease
MTETPFVIPNIVRNLDERGLDFSPAIQQRDRNDREREGGDFMREHNYYVYILTNWNHKVMYVGMTNDLERRLYEHKNKLIEGFTKRYNIDTLVYYEHTMDVFEAITREKEIKKWRREKKNKLVGTMNPEWKDLSKEWG